MNEHVMMAGGDRMPSKFDLTVRASIVNRLVAGFEKVVTPVGEFDCWKIACDLVGPREGVVGMPDYDMSMGNSAAGGSGGFGGDYGGYGDGGLSRMQFSAPSAPTVTSFVDYVSPSVGLVRREKLSDNGKRIVEVMELKKIINN